MIRVMRFLGAEFVGTSLLLAVIVGSGIMAERLAGGNDALALLANVGAISATLVALITIFRPVSGAHFNPIVSLALVLTGHISFGLAVLYVLAQLLGAVSGVLLAHLMFEVPLIALSTHARDGLSQTISELIATAGLLLVIFGGSRARDEQVPLLVGLYILGACWFTASTSFANPAVTLARTLTNTFTGIAPHSVPGFLVGQGLGLIVGLGLCRLLWPKENTK